MELLTVSDVAAILKMSKKHIYELTNPRYRSGDERTNPLPCLRIEGSVRFDRAAVEAWIMSHNRCIFPADGNGNEQNHRKFTPVLPS